MCLCELLFHIFKIISELGQHSTKCTALKERKEKESTTCTHIASETKKFSISGLRVMKVEVVHSIATAWHFSVTSYHGDE